MFRRIQLLDFKDFLACRVSTSVLRPDTRRIGDIASPILAHGFEWAQKNRDPEKPSEWWASVERIATAFDWAKLQLGDPVTAKIYGDSLEFGSIENYGGGCHRTIALAIAAMRGAVEYRPFDIKLHFC